MHGYFQYPVMMVPSMQGDLIRAVLKASPQTCSIFDPFAGSGTTLTEAMLNGLNYTGYDINPLAILVCRAKQGPFFARAIKDHLARLLFEIRKDRSSGLEADFPGIEKWFKPNVAIELSRIRRAIRELPTVQIRRFFWIALAESARLTVSVRSYQSRRPTDRTRSGPTCHPIPEPFPTSASVVLTPSARRSHDAPAVLLSGGSPSAATRRGDAAARAPGGSRPTGPGATTPGPSRRR